MLAKIGGMVGIVCESCFGVMGTVILCGLSYFIAMVRNPICVCLYSTRQLTTLHTTIFSDLIFRSFLCVHSV